MASIKFLIQSKRNPANIYVRLRDSSIDVKAKTPYVINSEKWSTSKGQVKNARDVLSKNVQSDLEKLRLQILTAYNSNQSKGGVNTAWLKNAISPKKEEIKSALLIDLIQSYHDQKIESLAKSSLQKILSIKKIILKYQEYSGRDFQMNHIDLEFNEEFKEYLREEEQYGPNYVKKVVDMLKTIGRYARTQGIPTSYQLESLTAKPGKVYKIFLTLEELGLIKTVDLPSESLEAARDWLIISCFTGQRVSDLLKLTEESITEMEGHRLISLKQQKGGKEVLLPIFPEVEEVLKKRRGAFPLKFSDQNYNRLIKEVGKLAGLDEEVKGALNDPETNRKVEGVYPKWKLISTHIGRRSLATNMYGKYATPLIMSMTGHTREATFLQYIGKGQSHNALALAELLSA
ncbi:phage integrase SAM-like domain-containing protein [uncultured Arcticibacterium sp.]|uniref:phage integrase SAM-like domain-containing protein n=1 Tax=uncultured Arcticibacterium sp. TaxID=2173042 RepID=UPI0030F6A1AB